MKFKQQTADKGPVFYGWYVVAVSALAVFFSGPGQTYGVSVFINSYIKDFDWSRSAVSGIYSAATLLSGSLLFLMGRSVDKFGQRIMAVVAGTMLALACFWSSIVIGPIMLFIGFLTLRFFGQGSLTLIPNTLVPQWFVKKRGRAMSFMAIGGFLSSALFPLLNAWLVTTYGWRVAWRVLGLLIIIIFVPIAYLVIRNKPENHGLLPDNAEQRRITKENKKEPLEAIQDDWTLKEAMKTRAFWMILFCVSLPAMINTGITFHLTSIFSMHGMGVGMASLVLSLMAVIGFPVTMAAGFILERIPVHKVIAFSFIGQLTFVIILIFTQSPWVAILFGIVWGLINGIERITLNIVWPDYFGRTHLGSIKGIAQTTMVIGSAFGPLPFGIFADLFHSYTQILLVMGIFPILGGLAAWLSPPPKKSHYFKGEN